MADSGGEVRAAIREFSRGKRCSHKRRRRVFSGQTGAELNEPSR